MLPITWNSVLGQWEVKDLQGKVLWRGNNYADAAQFADDYDAQQKNSTKTLLNNMNVPTGSVRG